MDEQQLNEIRERVNAASPPPWTTSLADGQSVYSQTRRTPICHCGGMFSPGQIRNNASFIARARVDVLDLLDALQAAEQRAEAAERLLERLTPGGSEFHDNPTMCAQWVTDRLSTLAKLVTGSD